ncbi:exocyst complex component Sec10-domain-containing protein [Cladochytrium replicatum]|nr:exocyst complex component Sec10-domain-containing protein [Cladochytrium replicatum]
MAQKATAAIAGVFKTPAPAKPAGPPKTIASLPPDLIVRIFTYLPVPNLPVVARVSRRFKILVYSNGVYEPKLRYLGLLTEDIEDGATLESGMEKLSKRLKQLPGGHMLPGSMKYLESGSLWGAPEAGTPTGLSSPAISAQLSSSAATSLIIGAGGLKAAIAAASRKKQSSAAIGAKATAKAATIVGKQGGRDIFKQVFTQLCPFYVDFRNRQKDSRVFREFKDLAEVATILRRLRLFSQARFLVNVEEANNSLEGAIEWFESLLLTQFERAYDANNISEMRRNAVASYQLNGGTACLQLFIAKNPIFYDHTYNPSLVASKLPSLAGPTMGYALSDEFAMFTDHTLSNSRKQAEIIVQVFPSEMDVVTQFLARVFEESISEYVNSVLVCARNREVVQIFLHTLASCVHCCAQFVDLMGRPVEFSTDGDERIIPVPLDTDKLKAMVANIFRPQAETYIDLEIQHLRKKFTDDIERWNHMKRESKKLRNAPYLRDQEKVQAHKRYVMKTVKAVLFAPVTLTKAVGSAIVQASNLNRVQPAKRKPGPTADLIQFDDSTDEESSSDDAAAFVRNGALKSPTRGDSSQKQKSSLIESAAEIQHYDYDPEGLKKLDDDSMGGLISLELCLSLMHTDKEGLGRALVITGFTDITKLRPNVEKVFIVLLKSIGQEHIKPAFQAAVDRLEKNATAALGPDPAKEALEPFFELVHIADLVQQMVDVYYQEDVKCWIDESDFMSEIVVEKKNFERLLDDQVAHGLDKSIMIIINQVDGILVREQKPEHFNPPETGAVLNLGGSTKACEMAIAALNSASKVITGVTDRHTMEVFYTEVGVRFFNAIVKHIKRYQISQTGAMQLIVDLNCYYEWATSVRVASVSKLFTVLKELGNIFLADAGPELRNLVHDLQRFQGTLRQEEIYELLGSRTDWKKIQKVVEAKDCIVM